MGLLSFELPDFKCIYANPMAKEILEVQITELEELTLQSLIVDSAKAPFRPLSPEILELEGLIEDIMLKKHSGQNFIASLGLKKIESGGKQYLLMMFQDVTFQKKLQREIILKQDELKQTYEDMLEQNRALKELDKAKDKFIALITHELRTPLSAIVATAEFLVMKLYDSDEQLQEFIKTINTEGLHLMAIVNDILDFSKIQTGKMEFYLEELDPSTVVEKQIESFQKMAEGNQTSLQFLKADTQVKCYYDPLRMNQIIANVVSNAIKFNKKGGTVTIAVDDQEDFVVVSIEDEGHGIPKEFEKKVFAEFETIENIKTHHKGTGLGMPISKKLIEGMGGKIWFESEIGVGTVFFVELPKKKVLPEDMYRTRPSGGEDLAA